MSGNACYNCKHEETGKLLESFARHFRGLELAAKKLASHLKAPKKENGSDCKSHPLANAD